MARTGLQHHTRVMSVGAHGRDHRRSRTIQIDENVACVLVSGVGLNIDVASFAVASAQKAQASARVGSITMQKVIAIMRSFLRFLLPVGRSRSGWTGISNRHAITGANGSSAPSAGRTSSHCCVALIAPR